LTGSPSKVLIPLLLLLARLLQQGVAERERERERESDGESRCCSRQSGKGSGQVLQSTFSQPWGLDSSRTPWWRRRSEKERVQGAGVVGFRAGGSFSEEVNSTYHRHLMTQ
jgi:hypothetical protein